MRRRDHYWSLYFLPEKRQTNDLRTDYVEAVFEVLPTSQHKDWLVWKEGFRTWKPLSDFPQLIRSMRQTASTPGPVTSRVPEPTEQVVAEAKASLNLEDDSAVHPIEDFSRPEHESSESSFNIEGDTNGAIVSPEAPKVASSSSDEDARSSKTVIKPAPKIETVAGTSASEGTMVARRLASQEGLADENDLSIMDETGLGDRDNRYNKKWEVRIHGTTGIQVNQTVNVSMNGMQLRDPLPKSLSKFFHVELKANEVVIPVVCSAMKTTTDGRHRIKIEVNDYGNALQSELIKTR